MANISGESTRLLTPRVSDVHPKRELLLSCFSGKICMPSKAVFVIFMWTIVVGAVYAFAVNASILLFLRILSTHPYLFVAILPPYVLLAFMLLCYPLNGLLADVCCGRYRAVMISMCVMCFSIVFGSVLFALSDNTSKYLYVFPTIGGLLAIVGISGYQANIIQFGLDQLMDAPSRYSGLFIHWVKWCDVIGIGLVNTFYVAFYSGCLIITRGHALRYLALICLSILLAIFLFSCFKRHWFHSEPGYQNPYKMVCKVLNFARKHKSPIYRSALTYYDDRKPSRMDFAKELYGGPFTSEQVEDVKTFLRILIVLISISPVYVLEVPTSYFMFPMFSLHTASSTGSTKCAAEWIVLQSGSLRFVVTIVFFPAYIWFVYTVLPKCIPSLKIVHRISFGITVFLLGVVSMLLIDVTGHALLQDSHSNSSFCMFALNKTGRGIFYDHETLNIPSFVLIIPNILVGIGQPVLIVSVLEFISAQSPHSMKGLMVGVFFASKGCVQLLSSLAVLPFSFKRMWEPSHHPLVTNCGFGYFLLTIVVALIGLIVFSVVAKRYKYRQRGEDPYGPHIVEQVVSNNLARKETYSSSKLIINDDIII